MPVPKIEINLASTNYADSFPGQLIHLVLEKIAEIRKLEKLAHQKKNPLTPEEKYAHHLIDTAHDFFTTLDGTLKHFDKQKIASLTNLIGPWRNLEKLNKQLYSPAKAIYKIIKKELPTLIASAKKEAEQAIKKAQLTKEASKTEASDITTPEQEFSSILSKKLHAKKALFIESALTPSKDAESIFDEISKLVAEQKYHSHKEKDIKSSLRVVKRGIYSLFNEYDYSISHQSTYDLLLFIAELMVQAPLHLKEFIPFLNPEVLSGENANFHGFFTRHILELLNLRPFLCVLDPEVPTDYNYQVSAYYDPENPEIELWSGTNYYKNFLVASLQDLLSHLTSPDAHPFQKAFSPQLEGAGYWIRLSQEINQLKNNIASSLIRSFPRENCNWSAITLSEIRVELINLEKVLGHLQKKLEQLLKNSPPISAINTKTVWQTLVEEIFYQCQNDIEILKQRYETQKEQYETQTERWFAKNQKLKLNDTAAAEHPTGSATASISPPEKAAKPIPWALERLQLNIEVFADTAKEAAENRTFIEQIILRILMNLKICLSSIDNFDIFKHVFSTIMDKLEQQKKATPTANWPSLYSVLGITDKIKAWCGIHSSGVKTEVSFFPREPNKKEVAALIEKLLKEVDKAIVKYESSLKVLEEAVVLSSQLSA